MIQELRIDRSEYRSIEEWAKHATRHELDVKIQQLEEDLSDFPYGSYVYAKAYQTISIIKSEIQTRQDIAAVRLMSPEQRLRLVQSYRN